MEGDATLSSWSLTGTIDILIKIISETMSLSTVDSLSWLSVDYYTYPVCTQGEVWTDDSNLENSYTLFNHDQT